MIRMNFAMQPDEQREKEKQEKSTQMKEDSQLIQLMNLHNLPVSLIDRFPWRISSWYEGQKKCFGCEGLKSCHQKTTGYYDNLSYDGLLQTVHTACRYERSKLKEEAHLSKYLSCDLPEELYTVTFNRINTAGEPADYLLVLNEAMKACTEKRGLYLYGTMGSGKSYLAACACNYHAMNGDYTAFVHYPSFCRRMAGGAANGEYKAEFGNLCYAKFLVLDDIGAESVTEWNRDQILLPLLSRRYEAGLPTWFTSNEDFVSLEKHFRFSNKGKEEEIKSARIMERVEHMAKPVAVTSKNRRKQL